MGGQSAIIDGPSACLERARVFPLVAAGFDLPYSVQDFLPHISLGLEFGEGMTCQPHVQFESFLSISYPSIYDTKRGDLKFRGVPLAACPAEVLRLVRHRLGRVRPPGFPEQCPARVATLQRPIQRPPV
jgi:hypothetical protein